MGTPAGVKRKTSRSTICPTNSSWFTEVSASVRSITCARIKLRQRLQGRGAVFIRNGTEHDSAKAAAHLRRKLGAAGKRVRTADQFITYLATGSSITGKPYKIRFADGRTVESAQFFREQLRRIEARPATAAKV